MSIKPYKMVFVFLAFQVLIKFNLSKQMSENAEMSNLIVNFMTSKVIDPKLPYAVLENMCWDHDSKFQLYSKLAKNDFFFGGNSVENNLELLQKGRIKRMFHFIIVTHLDCNFEKFYHLVIENDILLYPSIWLIFGNISQLYVNNLYIPVNRVFIIPHYNSTTRIWTLASLYKTNKYYKGYLKTLFGSWTSQGGLDLSGSFTLTRNRSNFVNMPLRVSYVFTKPYFNDVYTHRHKEKDPASKMSLFVMQQICDYWNMTHIMIFRNDWGFKYRHPTKHFLRGAYSDLLKGRSDILGTIGYIRLNIFKILYPQDPYFAFAIFYIAPPLPYYLNLYVLPFDTTCWILIITLMILIGICIGIIFIWEEKVKYFNSVSQQKKQNFSGCSDVLIMQLAIISQMGILYEPKSMSGKIVIFVALFTTAFLYTAFSANIVIFLQAKTTNIKSIADLHNIGYNFGSEDTTYNRYYFTKPDIKTNEYYRKLIYHNNLHYANGSLKNFMTVEEGVRQMTQNYFAFHADPQAAYYAIQNKYTNAQKCALRKVETIFKTEPMYVSLPKNSTYYEFLIKSIRRIQEVGLLARERKIFFSKMPKCMGHKKMFFNVGVKESYFAFYIFGTGYVISIILLILENLIASYIKRMDQNNVKILVKTKI